MEKALKAGIKEEVYNYIFWIMERTWNVALESSKGKEFVPQFVGIHDGNDVSWTQLNSTEGID
jgi:hypothetical protein